MIALPVVSTPGNIRSPVAPLTGPIVEISDVSKRFGRLKALDRVSASIRPGRITAILGPNAAGKSTLIKAMLGLTRPDAGVITVNGTTVNGDPGYRARVGYMPQAARFPENLTGHEVVAMLRDLRHAGAEDAELFSEFGLHDEMERPVRTLSGGTRQKLNAAVAFLFRPRLLVLDEPTAGLDPLARTILKAKILRARRDQVSVILSSHVLAELEELVDDIVFLSDGRVRFEGSIRRLKEMTNQQRLESAVARLMQEGTP